MDSEDRIVDSANSALLAMGMAPLPRERIRDIIGLGLREAVQTLFPDSTQSFCDRFVAHYRDRFLSTHGTPMPMFEGARSTLELLRERGYTLAVATGKSRRGLDRVLVDTGLAELFAATRCADETTSKPDPRMLTELMHELGAARHRTLMVGDSEYDLAMAQNAGVGAVGVGYGVHGCERLAQFGPLACLENITELPRWLDRSGRPANRGQEAT
jgi:phosphoglycolate phosphatase